MILFPAIDLYEGKAVRLYKGDYKEMTVYSEHPEEVAKTFVSCGASHIHLVDLEGARDGNTPNLATVLKIKAESGAFCEIGGGIRSMEVIDTYLENGLDRVILGTAAVKNQALLEKALERYGEKIAVGVDIKDGKVAIHGWTEASDYDAVEFLQKMESLGVKTFICTDISKDGAMQGTNHALYQKISQTISARLIASGGVSSEDDLVKLKNARLYGAIIGKAYYTGAIDLAKAVKEIE